MEDLLFVSGKNATGLKKGFLARHGSNDIIFHDFERLEWDMRSSVVLKLSNRWPGTGLRSQKIFRPVVPCHVTIPGCNCFIYLSRCHRLLCVKTILAGDVAEGPKHA